MDKVVDALGCKVSVLSPIKSSPRQQVIPLLKSIRFSSLIICSPHTPPPHHQATARLISSCVSIHAAAHLHVVIFACFACQKHASQALHHHQAKQHQQLKSWVPASSYQWTPEVAWPWAPWGWASPCCCSSWRLFAWASFVRLTGGNCGRSWGE